MSYRLLVKAKRWAQNPPSPAKIKFMAAIIGLCLILYGFEQVWGWPAWLTPHNVRPPR